MQDQPNPDIQYVIGATDDVAHQCWTLRCDAGETEAFADQLINVDVRIPSEYPFKPPTVKLVQDIYHPNVLNGAVCLPILNDWTPKNTVMDVLAQLRSVIMYPNVESALAPDIADEFMHRRQQYIDRAKVPFPLKK